MERFDYSKRWGLAGKHPLSMVSHSINICTLFHTSRARHVFSILTRLSPFRDVAFFTFIFVRSCYRNCLFLIHRSFLIVRSAAVSPLSTKKEFEF